MKKTMKIYAKLYAKLVMIKHTPSLLPGNRNKHERQDAFDAIRDEFKTQYTEEELEEKGALIDRYYHDVEKRKPCVVVFFLMKASVWTDVRQLKFALSGAK